MRAQVIVCLLTITLSLMLLGAEGCSVWADTDLSKYASAQEGTTTLHNDDSSTIYLSGCASFNYERLVNDTWEDQGPNQICTWEGIVRPLPPGQTLVTSFSAASEAGIYRLRYDVAWNCTEGVPMSQANCKKGKSVYTNQFEVMSHPAICEYYGKNYKEGESFSDFDHRNICTCHKNGKISCAEMLGDALRYYRVFYKSLSGTQEFGWPPNVVSDVNPPNRLASLTADVMFTLVADKDNQTKYLDIVVGGVGVNPGNKDILNPKADCSHAVQLTKQVNIDIDPQTDRLFVDVTPEPQTVNQEKTFTETTQSSTGFTVDFSADSSGAKGKASVSYNITKAKSVTMRIRDFNAVQTSDQNKPSWRFYATNILDVPDLSLYTFAPHTQSSFRAPINFNEIVPIKITMSVQLWWYQAKCPKDHNAKQVDFAAPYPNGGRLTVSETVYVDFSQVQL
jgi:hypothetical protein